MNIKVKQITDLDENTLDKIVDWMYHWWGKKEHYSKEQLRCRMKLCCQKETLPMTFGLYIDDKIIGMYQFLYDDDLFLRPDISPFLANLYIDKKYRNKGYSKILINSVKDNFPKNLGYTAIYLYTNHKNLYEKYGWHFITNVDTLNKKDKIQQLFKLEL